MIFANIEVSTANFASAQREMRFGYYGGAPGVLTSAVAWFCAGLAAILASPGLAIWVLFVGGMLIFPVSVLFCKAIGSPGKHAPGNPLGTLAAASTFWLIFSLPLAYAASLVRMEWFFPAMLLVIGGRYLVFSSIYGNRTYWACGVVLALAGYGLATMHASPAVGAWTGAAIEAFFAAVIFASTRREFAKAA